ncbi:MAG: NAD(P)-dependent oxidoreductase [Desulfosarcina sp.]|nr:NAD(P)-dependent oxidoreductase [Desulfobacterales bacterium]
MLALCKEMGVKKLVYISSCSVYGVADYKKGYVVTEDSLLERAPEARGTYSNAKFQAERVVLKAMKKHICPIVCLRPGTIFGPGGEIYTPMMGFSLGNRMFGVIGNGRFVLPLVYIDNLVDAIITAMEKKESGGKIYNVVDPDNITKKEYIKSLIKKLYPRSKCFYIPYSLLYSSVFLQEILSWILRRKPFLTRYRLTSSQKNILYDSSKIQKELNWSPPFSFNDAVGDVIQYEKDRHKG